MKLKYKTTLCLTLMLLGVGLALVPQQAQGAASTAASMELSADTFVADTLVTIRIYDITAQGSSGNIYFTYDSSGTDTLEAKTEYANITIHLGTNEDEWVITMLFPTPTAGDYVRVHYCGSASGSTTDLASDTIYVREWDDIWPGDFLIEVGIDVMIALMIVGIIVALSVIGAKKLRGG